MNNKLIIGLDIGDASVGWAVLLPNGENQQGRIIDLGVRCFDRAELPNSADLARRLQHDNHAHLAFRAQRLKKLRKYFVQQGLITSSNENVFITPADSLDPWQLRVKALDHLLSGEELARSLHHLVKHRGYHAARKAEELADEKSHLGRICKAVKENKLLFEQKKYRTVAELVLNEEEFKHTRGMKAGGFTYTFYRSMLRQELHKILNKQQRLNNSWITAEFIAEVDKLFCLDYPALTGKEVMSMVGYCTHETDQFRAAKSTFSAERFVWLSNLSTLRIKKDSDIRELTLLERTALIDLPLVHHTITYKTLRDVLSQHCDFPATSYFTRVKGNTAEEIVKAESKSFFKGEGYHTLMNAFSEQRWLKIRKDVTLLDKIATILTLFRTDEGIAKQLKLLTLTKKEINNLLLIKFSEFNNLSLLALRKINLYLEQGKSYHEACELCGYRSKNQQQKQKYLPSLYDYKFEQKIKKVSRIPEINNPMVMRALNQARKVLNELIKTYDSPAEIHLALAKGLSKPFENRRYRQRELDQLRREEKQLVAEFNELFGRDPSEIELFKLRLYREQSGKDAYPLFDESTSTYMLTTIDLTLLCDDGYVVIDYILPYSRSYDDSSDNKVLVLTKSNQDKGNSTPYEYLQGENNSQQWQNFKFLVKNNYNFSKSKKERLLRKKFHKAAANDWANRSLNDTRYVARFFSQFIKEHLMLGDENGRVVVPSGYMTATLRNAWGLTKDINASVLHHALDACVIAAAKHKFLVDVDTFNNRQILQPDQQYYENIEKYTSDITQLFPKPWETFKLEVEARLSDHPRQAIIASKLSNYSPELIEQVNPIFVSRMFKSPNNSEAICSANYSDKGLSIAKKLLNKLKPKEVDNVVGHIMEVAQTPAPSNALLIHTLKASLDVSKGDTKKAFHKKSMNSDYSAKELNSELTVK